jgi:predicted DNA-binding transcriptional regulator AlpA
MQEVEKSMEADTAKRGFTVEEAAAYLGISPQTIYNGISRRAAKPFPVRPKRFGRKPIFLKEDLDRMLEELPQ